jgi:GGDEF domain-containing protein
MAGHSLRMGASIGIALYPDNAKDIDALRHAADLAMYQVKKSGKGAYAFA